ncbi:hypothetical protein [Pseudovibrio sp. POLY-S9]|uniref:hypothetical protein n=1 Tax=Pseudovibrio sp. POLY-S9 TaxID=1576596 RepID=UPI00070C4428|nr:hypothetical protein [Pseudovibrio sp. POLY-S9]
MYNHTFYKDLFEKEGQRTESVLSSINLQVGLITVIAASAFVLLEKAIERDDWFWLLLGAIPMSISLLYAVYSVFRIFVPYKGAYLPEVDKIDEYWGLLLEYNEGNQQSAESDFEEYLFQLYKNGTKINSANNIKRLKYRVKANVAIFISIFSLIVVAAIFAGVSIKNPKNDDSIKVELGRQGDTQCRMMVGLSHQKQKVPLSKIQTISAQPKNQKAQVCE